MNDLTPSIDDLIDAILSAPHKGCRKLVALAGAPASGKSTLAEALVERLGARAAVVPMDGFHLDNRILVKRGLLERKGAPETFDAAGFRHLVERVGNDTHVIYPLFDRQLDVSLAGAGEIDGTCKIAVFEGNYLLFDAPIWCELLAFWDLSIRLNVPEEELRARLIARWTAHGLDLEQATLRAESNDLRNAQEILEKTLPADLEVR